MTSFGNEARRNIVELELRIAALENVIRQLLYRSLHHDHFASRMSDSELSAINSMKQLVKPEVE